MLDFSPKIIGDCIMVNGAEAVYCAHDGAFEVLHKDDADDGRAVQADFACECSEGMRERRRFPIGDLQFNSVELSEAHE